MLRKILVLIGLFVFIQPAFADTSALVKALQAGDKKRIYDLIDLGIGVRYTDPATGITPLHYVAGNFGSLSGYIVPLRERTSLIKELVRKGADVNARAKGGETPILAAARLGCASPVQALIDSGADVNAQAGDGLNALWAAATYNGSTSDCHDHLEIVRALVGHQANPNVVIHSTGKTALLSACEVWAAFDIDIVRALVDGGADLSREGQACLEEGFSSPKKYVLAIEMLNRGVAPSLKFGNAVDSLLNIPAQLSSRGANRFTIRSMGEVIRLFVEKGADSESLPNGRVPAIIRDVIGNKIDLIRGRIAAGENLDVREAKSNLNALMVATMLDRLEIADLLLNAHVDPLAHATFKIDNVQGSTDAFALAAFYSPERVLPLLMTSANVKDSLLSINMAVRAAAMVAIDPLLEGWDVSGAQGLIDNAVEARSLPALIRVLDAGVSVQGDSYQSPLYKTIFTCNVADEADCLPFMQELLKRGANPNIRVLDMSLFAHAAEKFLPGVLRAMKAAGAVFDAKSALRMSLMAPRYVVSQDVQDNMVMTMVELGFDPNEPYWEWTSGPNRDGENLTLWAAREGSLALNRWMYDHGGRFSSVDDSGNGVLPGVHNGVTEYWIRAGADVNHRNKDGETPLMRAVSSWAWSGNYRTLIAARADVNAKDTSGKSVLQYAKKACMSYLECDVLRALKEAGAR